MANSTMSRRDISTEQYSEQNRQVQIALIILGLVMAGTAYFCFGNGAGVSGLWSTFIAIGSWWTAASIRSKWSSND